MAHLRLSLLPCAAPNCAASATACAAARSAASSSASPPCALLLRPLRALVELKARDAAHAAAGRPLEPRGTLARQALMFKVVALGR